MEHANNFSHSIINSNTLIFATAFQESGFNLLFLRWHSRGGEKALIVNYFPSPGEKRGARAPSLSKEKSTGGCLNSKEKRQDGGRHDCLRPSGALHLALSWSQSRQPATVERTQNSSVGTVSSATFRLHLCNAQNIAFSPLFSGRHRACYQKIGSRWTKAKGHSLLVSSCLCLQSRVAETFPRPQEPPGAHNIGDFVKTN